jgi:hypothetical protein
MNRRMNGVALIAGILSLAVAASGSSPNSAHVTFSSGSEGWSLLGWDQTTPDGGNPGARIHWEDFIDNFWMAARSDSNLAFIGDYTRKGPVTLSIDWQVDYIYFFFSPVQRDLVVILYDDDTYNGAPPAAVWAHLGTLDGNGMDWTTFSADVTDVTSDTLPAGWNGAGDEDPVTFEPVLPAGRTWANVLQGVDRIEFTTSVPGWFFGFTNFNVSIDNVRITPITTDCPGDLDGSNTVDQADLGILLANFGCSGRPGACTGDLNGDGEVNQADLGILLANFGASCN